LQDQLLKYFPEHVKGLILLGDIYTNHVKNLDMAEKTYRRILEIDPSHVQGHHNLCVVMVEKKDLRSAHECLQQVHRLAPNEAYIKKHLAIVESRLELE
jgi:cytochrome c-type biogenesis protein CcmH/NrfG